MKFNRLAVLFVSLFFIAATAVSLVAQTSGTGAIAGTVTDSTGAVIPNATVVATNADTGQSRTGITGADGTYKFALLPPGAYNVKFSANGFKTTEVPRVAVAVTETPILDQKLELGTQTEQVTVEANAEAIQTTNAALGTVIGSTQVVGLPLTTRNYTNILGLSSGVSASVTNAGQLGKAGMDMSVNGASTSSNNMQIDGMNIDTFTGSNLNADNFGTYGSKPVPNPDALQEFKVQTSSYDAGYGRNSGANVNAVTKSGTNTFHGDALEFFRNSVLNANDFFLNLAGKPKGVLNQNQYGGTLGGPIKKDRLFFFAAYQGTHQDNGFAAQGNAALTLPPIPGGDRSNTAAFQAAVGSAFCPANHPGSSLYNTLRGGVQVACDGSNINPVAMNMLQAKLNGSYLFPGSASGGFQNTNFSIPALYAEQQELGNVDYVLSDKHTLSAHFFNTYSPATLSFATGTGAITSTLVPGFYLSHLYWDTTALLKVTSVLTPNLVNEARVSLNRALDDAGPNNSGLSDHQFGVQPVSPYQDYNLPGFMSTFNITGAYGVGGSGSLDFSTASSTAYQAADQISWTRGKHTIRAGFEAEQIRWIYHFDGLGSGNVAFSTFDDFLLGLPGCAPGVASCSTTNPGNTNGTLFSNIASTSASDGLGPAGNPHMWYINDYNAFVNDDVRLSSRLTFNVGLRYEYDGLTNEVYGVQTNVWPSAILNVPVPGSTPATGSLAGWVVANNYSQTFASVPGNQGTLLPGVTRASSNYSIQSGPQKDNFAPRVGFAWQPIGGNKLVIRGGYGFFYDRVPGGTFIFGVTNSPPLAPPADKSGQSNYYATLAVPFGPTANSFPYRWVNFATLTSSNISQQLYGSGLNSTWITPLVQNYNMNIQYQFAPTWVLEVGYVGSRGTHTSGSVNINSAAGPLASTANPIWGLTTNTVANAALRVPYLGFSSLSEQCSCLDTKFSSLQVTLRKQFSHGFQGQAAYTWARAFTDGGTPNPDNFAQNYGPSTAIRPQRLVINYSWNVPSGNLKGFAGKLMSGWSLSGVTTIQGGTPLTLTDGRGGTIYGLTSSTVQIAAGKTYADIATPGGLTSRLGGGTGGCGYFTSPTTAGTLSNGTACSSLSPFVVVPNVVAPDGTATGGTGWGNAGVGIILGPGQFNFDAAIIKTTKVGGIREDATLQFRAEFFNVFNHPQFSNPATTDSASTFGQITSTTVNPRIIQLGLKYIF